MSGVPKRHGYRYLRDANDRFKVEGRPRLAWSTLAAAALHVFAFFGLPTWRGQARLFEPKPWEGSEEWVVVSLRAWEAAENVDPGLGGDGVVGEVDVGAEAGLADDAQLMVGETAGLSEALKDALFGSTLVPTLAEPQPAQGSREAPSGSGSVRIEGGGATTVALEGLAAADSLALDLLNALRPEIVLLDPSVWILIRNPTVVENFMRQRASNLPDLNGARRSTSVALWIDETGSVEWAEVSQSSGRTDLDELALELFSEVVSFRPARDHGVRIPTTAVFTVHFPW